MSMEGVAFMAVIFGGLKLGFCCLRAITEKSIAGVLVACGKNESAQSQQR